TVLEETGSRERTLPGLEVDGTLVQTSREALEDARLPASLVVVGGGAGGVEFAYAFASFGTKVTVVEMEGALLPGRDVDLGRELQGACRKQGIDVLVDHRFERLEGDGGAARITLAGKAEPRTIQAERVLVAVGRSPLSDDLGLEPLGVRTQRGFVVVDPMMRTSVPGTFAIGDLVGPLLLAHTASEQGVIAVETIPARPDRPPGLHVSPLPI